MMNKIDKTFVNLDFHKIYLTDVPLEIFKFLFYFKFNIKNTFTISLLSLSKNYYLQ